MGKFTITVEQPNEQAMLLDAEAQFTVADVIRITNDENYRFASEQRADLQRQILALKEQKSQIARPMREAQQHLSQFFEKPLSFLNHAVSVLDGKLLAYVQDQKRVQREKEAEAREAQRKEQKRLRQEAAEQARAGHQEIAETMCQEADMMPAIVTQAAPVKSEAVVTKQTWVAECTNLRELCAAIGRGEASENLVKVNQSSLNKHARALEDNFAIPGCRAFPQDSIANRPQK